MRSFAALVVFGAVLSACGGEDLGRPAPPEAVKELEPTNWCEVVEGYEFLRVLDFEPAGTSSAICDVAGQTEDRCNWYAGTDGRHGCTNPLTMLRPTGGTNFPGEAIPGGRCGVPSTGLHVVGTRVAQCIQPDSPSEDSDGKIGWGANFQVDALPVGAPDTGGAACGETPDGVPDPGSAFFDASCWDGVSFWARKSGPSGGSSLTVTVTDVFTSMSPIPNEAGAYYCSISETAPDSTKCDAMGRVVTMTEEWQFFVLPWNSLNQKGYGVPSLLGRVDSGNIKGLTILVSPGDWDFWVDDVSFFRKAP
jgi:hypothetical protein